MSRNSSWKNTEKQRQKKRKHEAEMALARFGMMFDTMNRLTHGRMYDYMESARLMDRISLHPSKYW